MYQEEIDFIWTNEDGSIEAIDPHLIASASPAGPAVYKSGSLSSSTITGGCLSISGSTTTTSTISTSSYYPTLNEIFDEISNRLEAIEHRLAILNLDEDPTHQTLNTLYKKYKMVETLIGDKKEDV